MENRKIIFRAKEIPTGNWVYWFIYQESNEWWIKDFFWKDHHIDQKTIWQYTWLKDRNWKEIYEQDIVIPNTIDDPCVVEYSEVMCRFILMRPIGTFTDIQNTREVIGNIYENPDLISKNE